MNSIMRCGVENIFTQLHIKRRVSVGVGCVCVCGGGGPQNVLIRYI